MVPEHFSMRRSLVALQLALSVSACALAPTLHAGDTKSVSVSKPIYFSQDWCPLAGEIEALEKHFLLTMNGCCIFKAERRAGSPSDASRTVERFLEHMVAEQDLGVCTSENVETQAARRAELRAQEAERLKLAEAERRELPARLRTLDIPSLCLGVGNLLRGEPLYEAPALRDEAVAYVTSELRRRGIRLDAARVRAEKIRIGDSECHLFAAWGLPNNSNRTVTRSGVSTQHVYGRGNYVYTDNGRITAWQD